VVAANIDLRNPIHDNNDGATFSAARSTANRRPALNALRAYCPQQGSSGEYN
jgi:hypothetical protein